MGIGDKIQNKAEEIGGKVKEAVGDATDNERLQAEGAADQAGAKAKQAGESVKDGVKDAGEDAKAAWNKATN
ncbi:CsbD family protein [Micropruina sonneratiae]|uniref:CsbD family protein n=1 Tax=Micropruina sonneratiae TaxID=2986940 RepID=UPI002226BB71|nr:CsbD family protein [Micropruina sp. KQZ13P-5]MCW3158726.1 CsbD family protein [Micropruina sp. KQZ13P-5]